MITPAMTASASLTPRHAASRGGVPPPLPPLPPPQPHARRMPAAKSSDRVERTACTHQRPPQLPDQQLVCSK